jgi:phosphoglycerate kinase
MATRSIRDLNLKGRRVFVRVDFNVPLKNGVIGDDTRIRASVPTIQYALDAGAKCVVVASHLGRPKGKPNPEMSLRPVAARLGELTGRHIVFAEDCVGPAAEQAVAGAPDGSIVLVENLRFHSEEEKNDAAFAAQLAKLADVYVNDAFGAAHRAHASVEAMVRLMPEAGAGLLMEKELRYLGGALQDPQRPFVAIIGGAKVSDKIEVIENLIPRVDCLIIGGAMAYTFFRMPRGTSSRVPGNGTCRCCCRPTTWSRQSWRPARPPRRCRSTTPRLATGWAWTSAPPPRSSMPTRSRLRRPSCGTARWACSRSTPSPPAPWPWPARCPT